MDAREKRCPRCGASLAEDAVTCRACGSLLIGEGGAAEPGLFGKEAVSVRRRHSALFWFVAVLGLACLLGLMALIGYGIYQGVSELTANPDSLNNVEQITSGELDPADTLPNDVQEDLDNLLDDTITGSAEILDYLDDTQLEALAIAYLSCFEGNDRDAMAALFHPSALAAYGGDANAIIESLDEQSYLYGTKLSSPALNGAIEVEPEGVTELSEALGETVERAMLVEYSAQTDAGEEFLADLLCVRVNGQWYLYYAY